ncbi:spore protease YyaC [Bacillus sp. EB106-08-02-XG196]|uniref:spore protease YyaC n=1 Tax=Bacillus sp. EB106-08-02-XG196 TaxID=2737049 RepID=UPI0015C46161|nr:spore protease YyaC [Bacillus sp. EB106-08-02-XG196]NWQ41432.1 spore protease YyaC [Bacillus sp. EB106-08-02-XG196]
MWSYIFKRKNKDRIESSNIMSLRKATKEAEIEKISNTLKEVLCQTSKEIVFLCVGTDRSTGDSLGPMVGTMLKEKNIPFPVYGTLEQPVHALNIKKIIKDIHKTYDEPFIFGIDACLGDEGKIGSVFIKEGAFIPGNAVNNVLPSVGNYHLKAIVNYLDPLSPVQSLNSTRLYTVKILAEIVTEIIIKAAFDGKNLQNDRVT